jgi:hypothetical protein
MLADDADLRHRLGRIAELGHEAIPGASGASITLIERGLAVTTGASNELALELDSVQYHAGAGPCLAAAAEKRTITTDTAPAPEWPSFRNACARLRVSGSISVPLLLDDGLAGGFNLYRGDSIVVPVAVQLSGAFAGQATALVVGARAFWAAAEFARTLTGALATRGVLEQAKDHLMTTKHMTAEQAFDALRKRAQHESRTVHAVAVEIADHKAGS